MSFERIMGLEVIDDVLKSKTDKLINRVFTIDFPSRDMMNTLFSDQSYLEVKSKYFKHSVKSVITISIHEKNI
jgi:hypothetical protein